MFIFKPKKVELSLLSLQGDNNRSGKKCKVLPLWKSTLKVRSDRIFNYFFPKELTYYYVSQRNTTSNFEKKSLEN